MAILVRPGPFASLALEPGAFYWIDHNAHTIIETICVRFEAEFFTQQFQLLQALEIVTAQFSRASDRIQVVEIIDNVHIVEPGQMEALWILLPKKHPCCWEMVPVAKLSWIGVTWTHAHWVKNIAPPGVVLDKVLGD